LGPVGDKCVGRSDKRGVASDGLYLLAGVRAPVLELLELLVEDFSVVRGRNSAAEEIAYRHLPQPAGAVERERL
jgi:hypothetical protein